MAVMEKPRTIGITEAAAADSTVKAAVMDTVRENTPAATLVNLREIPLPGNRGPCTILVRGIAPCPTSREASHHWRRSRNKEGTSSSGFLTRIRTAAPLDCA